MENIHESISFSFLPPNDFGGSILIDWTYTGASTTYAGVDYCTYNYAPACSWAEVAACPNLWISPEIKGCCLLSYINTLYTEAAPATYFISLCAKQLLAAQSFKSSV